MNSLPEQALPTRERSPLAELATIAIPAVIAMISHPAKLFVDARMVAVLGPEELTAQGDGGLVAFFPTAALIGGLSVISTYVSQNLGAGRPQRGAAYLWNGLWICALFSVLALGFALFVEPIFVWMGHEAPRIALETSYCQILLYGAFFSVAPRAVGNYFYGLHRPNIVMAAAGVGFFANVFFNWLLIYGNWGCPALGLDGAAWATVAASAVEFAIPFTLFLLPSFDARFHTRRAWRLSAPILHDLWRIGWPGAVMVGNELLCWAIFMGAIVGGLGVEEGAASWIALRYMMLAFQPTLGLQMAVAAVVGRQIGRGDPAAAEQRAWLGVRIGMAYMGAFAVAMVVFREPMLRFFITDGYTPEQAARIVEIGKAVMVCSAVFQVFDALGILMIGALRGAGDTLWPGVVNTVLSWGLVVGLGFAIVKVFPQWGAVGPWGAAAVFIITLGLAVLWRFIKGPWRSMVMVDRGEAPAAEPAPALTVQTRKPEGAGASV